MKAKKNSQSFPGESSRHPEYLPQQIRISIKKNIMKNRKEVGNGSLRELLVSTGIIEKKHHCDKPGARKKIEITHHIERKRKSVSKKARLEV